MRASLRISIKHIRLRGVYVRATRIINRLLSETRKISGGVLYRHLNNSTRLRALSAPATLTPGVGSASMPAIIRGME